MIRDLAGRVENCVLRWIGHMERLDGEKMKKRIYESEVEG